MKKYILGAVLALGILVVPASTMAAGLTSTQISAVLGLLQAFGADSATIANVNAALTGIPAPVGGRGFCYNFDSDLTVGSAGDVVSKLRFALIDALGRQANVNALSALTFDENDAATVVLFQAKYGIRQTGYVGPMTRAKLNSLYSCANQSINQLNQAVQDQLTLVRARGADASIQSSFSTVRVQAELYYSGSGNNSYAGVCADATMTRALNSTMSANGGVTPTCNSSATAYAASSPLNSDSAKYWCIDSTGFAGNTTTALGTNTACSTRSTIQPPSTGSTVVAPPIISASAPFITSASSDLAGNAGIEGIRIVSSRNGQIKLNGRTMAYGSSGGGYYTAWNSGGTDYLSFKPTDFGITSSGNYSVQIINSQAGDSNIAYLNYIAPQIITAAPTVTITANPSTIIAGQSSVITLSSANANSYCSISNIDWSSGKTNASTTVSPTQTTTYTATCVGAGGSTSKSVTVTVNQPAIAVPPVTNGSITITSPLSIANHTPFTISGTSSLPAGSMLNIGISNKYAADPFGVTSVLADGTWSYYFDSLLRADSYPFVIHSGTVYTGTTLATGTLIVN